MLLEDPAYQAIWDHLDCCAFVDALWVPCPCELTWAFACASCGRPVWVLVPPGRRCSHTTLVTNPPVGITR